MLTYDRVFVTILREEPVALLNQVLYDLALVWHVVDHVCHVVLRVSHQGRSEHDGQVARVHLKSIRLGSMTFTYIIHNKGMIGLNTLATH